jgi:lupus La protein
MAEKIKKQIEFYFSDSNFRRDKFLQELANKHELGFVGIDVLLTFNKLKSMTEKVEDVASAVEDSDIVVVSEDGTSLRRANPLPEDDDTRERSLYAKGFPVDDPDVTIDSMENLFNEYGTVKLIKFRKDFSTKKFKGGVFVEYSSVDEMKGAVAKMLGGGDNKDEVTFEYKGNKLLCVLPMVEWWEKHIAKQKRKKEAKKIGSNDKKKRSLEDTTPDFTAGCIVKVSGLPTEGCSLDNLRILFKEYGDLKFIEWNEGDVTAVCRYANSESATTALSTLEKAECKLNETVLEGKLIEGDEETEYWKRYAESSKEAAKRQKTQKSGRGGGRGRGGRGRGGKRQVRDF